MLTKTATEPCDRAFRQEVLEACRSALVASGFTRFRKDGVDYPLQTEFHCWVGLNAALTDSFVEISPFVGIHNVPIEKLWTRLKTGKYGGKYDRGVATLGRHLGELAPHEPAFFFTRRTNLVEEAHRLSKLFATVGLSFSRGIANYPTLLPLLAERSVMLGGFPERYACCLHLMGRKNEAQTFVRDFLSDHRDYFEGFAIPYLNMSDQSM